LTTPAALAIIAIFVCALLIFFFSLAETALVACRTSRLEQLSDSEAGGGERRRSAINAFLREPTRIVAAVQIGITVLSVTDAAIAIGVLTPPLAHGLSSVHFPHPIRVAIVILVILVSVLVLVVGEIVPRAIAVRQPERVALFVAVPLQWIEMIERPATAVVLGLSNVLVKPFGLSASFSSPVITEEELKTLLDTSEQEGVIEQDEKEMLRNVISFADTSAHAVMTPRIDMKAADVTIPVEKLINLIVDCGHSRIPIYEDTVDHILGVIHAKDLLPALATGMKGVDIRALTRTVVFVPENKRVDELLEEFRRSNTQLAIVQDEYGGTAGVVTVEDLLEEIVGEIQDEYDVESPLLVREDDGTVELDARMSIDDVNEELDLSLPKDDFDTVGGFVFGLFGRMPQQGESVEHDGVTFTITQTDGRRVYRLKIGKTPPPPEADGQPHPA
jgi:putative hemolysin